MDLKAYYQKLRSIEADLTDEHVVIVSLETSDGGRAGVKTEVTRFAAAKMILEGRARLATKEEAGQFYKAMVDSKKAAEQAQMATRLQVNVISEADIRALKGMSRTER